jgi:hypothetical protein
VGYEFTLDDVAFLRSPAGGEALAEVARLPLRPTTRLADVAAARKVVGPRYSSAALETVLLRQAATAKVDNPARWLFTDAALQQATAWPVAKHRAARFAGRVVHDVTCSVGTDLLALSTAAIRCVGSDVDEVRLAMARHNIEAVSPGAQPRVDMLLARADALRPVTRETAVLVDPGRRDGSGRRQWRPADFSPPLDDVAAVYRNRDLVVKCAPGIDRADVPWAREVEIVSLDGRVRESCLWTGELATDGVRRRASVLRADGAKWTITDAEPDDCPVRTAGEWIIDPDGAVVRAGLVRHYAARHGLGQLDERIAYLTGDTPPPGVRAFRVLDQGRYTEKALRQVLHRHGIGRLEILIRGLDVDPDALRLRLRLRGDGAATVVLTRIGRTPMAFVCRQESPAE